MFLGHLLCLPILEPYPHFILFQFTSGMKKCVKRLDFWGGIVDNISTSLVELTTRPQAS